MLEESLTPNSNSYRCYAIRSLSLINSLQLYIHYSRDAEANLGGPHVDSKVLLTSGLKYVIDINRSRRSNFISRTSAYSIWSSDTGEIRHASDVSASPFCSYKEIFYLFYYLLLSFIIYYFFQNILDIGCPMNCSILISALFALQNL